MASLQFEVPSDGIIDDLKRCICHKLTTERFYLPRRSFHLQSGGVRQPYFTKLKELQTSAELTFQWSVPDTPQVEMVD